MMAEKYFDMITKWEEQNLTEEQIVNRFIQLIEKDKDNPEIYYDVNDALNWKGYSYNFEPLKEVREEFDGIEYADIVSNASKSKQKTYDLLTYLWKSNDWRLTLNSLHYIKVSKLIELDLIKGDNNYVKENKNLNLYDFYMGLFKEENSGYTLLKKRLEQWLETIGLSYVTLDYMQFRMYIEYLLSTISINKKIPNGYIKANTIKVAFSICPREYLVVNYKEYYNQNIQKNLVSYLGLIDKKEIKRIKDMYNPLIDQLDDTGYKLLFNII